MSGRDAESSPAETGTVAVAAVAAVAAAAAAAESTARAGRASKAASVQPEVQLGDCTRCWLRDAALLWARTASPMR